MGGGPACTAARAVLDVLERRGVPNWFGAQRFGARGDTADLGRALASGDAKRFLDIFLGGALESDPPDCRAAREAFAAGDLENALARWPRRSRDERAALSVLLRGKSPEAAIGVVDKRMKKLYVSAFQSLLFNAVLAKRLDAIDRVFAGDIAQKTDTGGIFLVEDAGVEQLRCDAFEISATGPIFGEHCDLAQGEPGRVESEVMDAAGIPGGTMKRASGAGKLPGGRRALRFRVENVFLGEGGDEHGPYVELKFDAPSGAYATVVLAEVMKA